MINLWVRDNNGNRDIRNVAEMSDITTPSIHLITIWAEQNGAIVTNRFNFSFGNGNEHNGTGINDWGYVTPYDGVIDILTIGMRATNTADTTIVVTINGVDSTAQATISGAQTKIRYKLPTQIAFNAGDTLNFRTLAVGGGNDVVVSAALLLDITT